MTRSRGRIGLIGGSGVYDLSGIEDLEERRVETPFGEPSDSYFTGTLDELSLYDRALTPQEAFDHYRQALDEIFANGFD